MFPVSCSNGADASSRAEVSRTCTYAYPTRHTIATATISHSDPAAAIILRFSNFTPPPLPSCCHSELGRFSADEEPVVVFVVFLCQIHSRQIIRIMCQIEQTPPHPWFKLNSTAIPKPRIAFTGGYNVWIRTGWNPIDYLSYRLAGTQSVISLALYSCF